MFFLRSLNRLDYDLYRNPFMSFFIRGLALFVHAIVALTEDYLFEKSNGFFGLFGIIFYSQFQVICLLVFNCIL